MAQHPENSGTRKRTGSPPAPAKRPAPARAANTSVLGSVELHPLLREMASLPPAAAVNPLKQRGRRAFDAAALNPYIDQHDIAHSGHRARPLQLNPKGKYIEKGDQLRAREEAARQEARRVDEQRRKGLLPDANTQEQLWQPQAPPPVEWWDRPYVPARSYAEFYAKGAGFDTANDDAPVSLYIQHPVPVPAPWERDVDAKVYLTKREMKRKRRNERQLRHKEAQDRIRLGLDAPPPPKVKLSNLMNVLTNEAIQDPTGVEMRVRQEVQARHEQHMRQNEARKPTPEARRQKQQAQQSSQLSRGLYTTVYKVDTLDDRQQFFKVDMNAKQLNLFGVLLKNPRFCLVIAEGSAKSIQFFKKLMTKRIQWSQSNTGLDLSANRCQVVWEGELKALSFAKWSPMYTQTDDEAYKVLNKFGHENYWREAVKL